MRRDPQPGGHPRHTAPLGRWASGLACSPLSGRATGSGNSLPEAAASGRQAVPVLLSTHRLTLTLTLPLTLTRRPLLDAGLRGLELHTSKLEFSVEADGGELEADIDKALDDAMR